MKKKILVTGSNGYLASYIHHIQKDQFDWILMTRKNADFSDPDAVAHFIKNQDFDYCYHTAANATTAWCNEHPDLAHTINVESTKKIVDLCKEKGARLIFSATEQSFNGKESRGPFKEEESLSSVTIYGQNKQECEEYIQEQLEDYLILRYSWQMGLSFDGVKASPNIIKNVMDALLHQKPTKFTCNEKRCLTYAKHLAEQFDQIIDLDPGIYHVAAQNEYTTYEAAIYIAKQLGANKQAIESYILPNHERYQDRFRDYRLDSTKLENLGIHFGSFEENVDEVLKDFNWK